MSAAVHHDDHDDPKTSITVIAGLVGTILTVVTVVFLQAFYYKVADSEFQAKVEDRSVAANIDKRADQTAQLNRLIIDEKTGRGQIPIDRAMEIVADDLARGRQVNLTTQPASGAGGAAP